MPELPEVEITARLLDRALCGARDRSTRCAPGINALKTFDPPLSGAGGRARRRRWRRRGKHLILEIDGGLALLIHLMSAGRLQLYEKRGRPARSHLAAARGLEDGRELRLREFGSKQAAWVKLLAAARSSQDEALATLGPEAWPEPPPLGELLDAPRPLHALLRDQHVIAGIGRSWVDEILWARRALAIQARAPTSRTTSASGCSEQIPQTLGERSPTTSRRSSCRSPTSCRCRCIIHRHEGEPCPRCASTLKAVHFEDYVIAYCPRCQTEGRVLKDRRLSRLLR